MIISQIIHRTHSNVISVALNPKGIPRHSLGTVAHTGVAIVSLSDFRLRSYRTLGERPVGSHPRSYRTLRPGLTDFLQRTARCYRHTTAIGMFERLYVAGYDYLSALTGLLRKSL